MNPSDFYDVIVAGGGFSGVAAAIAAAREGVSGLLIEKSNCLGGAAANCLVNPFMPYWTKINEKKVNLCQGIFLEICEELQKNDGIHKNGMEFDEEILKLVLNRMVLKAGVRLLFHSCLADAERDQEQIRSVTVLNKSGRQTYRAHCFIDATGDADLAVLCGVPFRLGRDEDRLCQPMTLCFRIAGVDIDKRRHGFQKTQQLYKQWRKEGKIKNPREDILLFETLQDGVIHVNSTRIVKRNPVDAWDRTQAEIEAREQVFELFRFLKENAAGFENSRLLSTAMEIGVRESRRIDGVYTLTAEDLKACTRFEDAIALGNYDIDIHNPSGTGTSHYLFPDAQYYTIPYRCLVPLDTQNLLVTGRCISTTHEAQASIRIMPIVCCLGQAAGVAAAVAIKDKTSVRHVDVPQVQMLLKKAGAVTDDPTE